MVTKSDIENALQKAGIEILDELPNQRGGWVFTIAGMTSGQHTGRVEAIVAGLKAAEEIEHLCRRFNSPAG